MRHISMLFVLSITVPTTSAQLLIRKSPCKYDRSHAVLRRIKQPAIHQFDMNYPAKAPDLSYTFPSGTIVSVSQQQDGWSCVYGSKFTSSGWKTFSGWVPTTQLEKPEEPPPSSD